MRRSFDRLAATCETALGANPLSGHLFLFRNRRGDRVKILYWDRDGYAIWYKRLEEGTFNITIGDEGGAEISATELAMILGGVDPAGARQRRRYRR